MKLSAKISLGRNFLLKGECTFDTNCTIDCIIQIDIFHQI